MFNFVKNEKGVILPLLGILVLLAGIVGGYFLLKNPQIFKSRADNPAIVAKDRNGNPLEVVNNVAKTTDTKIKLELTSPLGPAGSVSSPSPIPVSKPQPPTPTYSTPENTQENAGADAF